MIVDSHANTAHETGMERKNTCGSRRLFPFFPSTRFECIFSIFSTRFECSFHVDEIKRQRARRPYGKGKGQRRSQSPVKSEHSGNLLHSFRVYFQIFRARFECSLTSFSLVSSVVCHLSRSFRVRMSLSSQRSGQESWKPEALGFDVQTRFEFSFCVFSTRFECSFCVFSTRFECI